MILSVPALILLLTTPHVAFSGSTEERCISTCASFYTCSWENGRCIKTIKQPPYLYQTENSLKWTASACCKVIPPPELERAPNTVCLPAPNENNIFSDKDSCQAYLDRKISECEQIGDYFNGYANIISAKCSGPPEAAPTARAEDITAEAGGDKIPDIPESTIHAISKLEKDPSAETLSDAIIQNNGLSSDQANELRKSIASWKARIMDADADQPIRIDPPKELSNGPSMVAISKQAISDGSITITSFDDPQTVRLFKENMGAPKFPIGDPPPAQYEDKVYFKVNSQGATFEDVWFSYDLKADPGIQPSQIKILRWDEESGLWVKQPTYAEKKWNFFEVTGKPDHNSYFTVVIEKQSNVQNILSFFLPILISWFGILYLELRFGKDKTALGKLKSEKTFRGKIDVFRQIKFTRFVFRLGMLVLGGILAIAFIMASIVEFGLKLDPGDIFLYVILGMLLGLAISLITRALSWLIAKLLHR